MVTISDVKVYPVKSNKWVAANVQFTVDGAFVLKATLMKSDKGPWLAFPGKKGEKADENGKFPFYADIKCVDKELAAKLLQDIQAEYTKRTGGVTDQTPRKETLNQVPDTNDIPFG